MSIGNHDITLDTEFYKQNGNKFHNQNRQDPAICQQLIENTPSIIWLKHESAVIHLVSPVGPQTTFKIFGSPFSRANGVWAFGYLPEEAPQLWNQIPADCDIVVTHTPPKYHCDQSNDGHSSGCEALLEKLGTVRPRLAICGHLHGGRGAQRIQWDRTFSNDISNCHGVEQWNDLSKRSNIASFIDLSFGAERPLENDGSVADGANKAVSNSRSSSSKIYDAAVWSEMNGSPFPTSRPVTCTHLSTPHRVPSSSREQGGNIPQPTGRRDFGNFTCDTGRLETFVINAAIMASSWPHAGGKKFNKPIVVDIDLPVSIGQGKLSCD
jgi:hypothetical protein